MQIRLPRTGTVYSATDLAVMAQVPVELVRRYADDGRIPCQKLGRTRTFSTNDIEMILVTLAGAGYTPPARPSAPA